MRWKGGRQSKNVEDRRAQGPARKGVAIGGIGIVLLLAGMFIGGDFGKLLSDLGQSQMQGQASSGPATPFEPSAEEQELVAFVKTVLAYTEDVWHAEFRKLGKRYEEPVLVIFRGSVQSACGVAGAQVGPFYCPGDHKLYIDLSFYKTLREKLGEEGKRRFTEPFRHQNMTRHIREVYCQLLDKVNGAGEG